MAGDYQRLFGEVDALIFLAAPSFGVVEGWRLQQESELQAGSAVMDARRVHRFVQHYQRLTEWILREMPTRADLTARLDEQRRVTGITSSRT